MICEKIKNIVITPQDEISLLLFYKKKSKSLLTSWLTFLLYNCSVNIPWKQPKKFFLALFSNFNQQQQLLVKKTILYSSCQQAVFLFVKYYIFPLSFSQMKDEYTMAMISPMFHWYYKLSEKKNQITTRDNKSICQNSLFNLFEFLFF